MKNKFCSYISDKLNKLSEWFKDQVTPDFYINPLLLKDLIIDTSTIMKYRNKYNYSLHQISIEEKIKNYDRDKTFSFIQNNIRNGYPIEYYNISS